MIYFKFIFSFILTTSSAVAEICMSDFCEFTFVIRYQRTMIYRSENGNVYDVQLRDGKLQIVENSYHILPDENIGRYVNADDVITADGVRRNVITVNGQFPGPTLEVMEGAQVAVHVKNMLPTESTTIHWHGLLQWHNPWMDGAAYITQCPIVPRQTFTYWFRASPAGAHWYHSHMMNQRQDGLYGAFIVHARIPETPYNTMIVSDWIHEEAKTVEVTSPYHIHPEERGSGEFMSHAKLRGYSTDGIETTAIKFVSALINGRGRLKSDQQLPLMEFKIERGSRKRLHVINAAGEYAFEMSVDHHMMTVVASDGQPLKPVSVNSLILNTGETFDVEVEANQAGGSYWIRVQTLREGWGNNTTHPDPQPDDIVQHVKAILSYNDSDVTTEPTSHPVTCSEQTPCLVLNCPYSVSPRNYHRKCISIAETRSDYEQEYLDEQYGLNDDNYEEYFFNVGFNWGSSINGFRFVNPAESLTDRFIYGDSSGMIPCDTEECLDPHTGCACTHIMTLPFNKTVQFVISNLQLEDHVHPEHFLMGHHPMHIHGHLFAVLHIGYPEYNITSGRWRRANSDLVCESAVCKTPSWTTVHPELNLKNPPIKDTVNVPASGYVVIRMRTTNPGLWHLHCHADSHLMEGMNIIFHEAPGRYAPPPTDFPKCYHYSLTREEFTQQEQLADQFYRVGKSAIESNSFIKSLACSNIDTEFLLSTIIVVSFAGVLFTDAGRGLFILPFIYITIRCRRQQKNGYQLLKSQ